MGSCSRHRGFEPSCERCAREMEFERDRLERLVQRAQRDVVELIRSLMAGTLDGDRLVLLRDALMLRDSDYAGEPVASGEKERRG